MTEPRRTIIGTFPTGGTQIIAFEDVEGEMIAAAARKLDADKAEAERVARQTLTVDRAWFISTMKTLMAYMETERRWHAHNGDLNRRDLVAWRAYHLRNWLAENAEEPPA